MPPKRYNYEKNFQKKSKKLYSDYKKKKPSVSTMVNKTSIRDHTIIADRFMTKMSASFTGAIAAAASAAAEFTIYGNSIFQPFNTANLITGLVTAQQGSAVANPPMGYTALTGLYNQYRVRGSRIKVTCNPTSALDICNIVVLPVPSNYAQTTPYRTMNQKYARWKNCTASNNVKENTIIHYMSSNEILGLTKQQYDDQLPTLFTAAPAANLDWYWEIGYTNSIGGVNAAAIVVTVEIDMYVEFSDSFYFAA